MKIWNRFRYNRHRAGIVVAMICFIFGTGCSVVGIRTTEEASYTVLAEYDPIEIRDYKELIAVETDVEASYDEASNIAFKKLFDYISGENLGQSKIAMTAPVMSREKNAGTGEKVAMTSSLNGFRLMA